MESQGVAQVNLSDGRLKSLKYLDAWSVTAVSETGRNYSFPDVRLILVHVL